MIKNTLVISTDGVIDASAVLAEKIIEEQHHILKVALGQGAFVLDICLFGHLAVSLLHVEKRRLLSQGFCSLELGLIVCNFAVIGFPLGLLFEGLGLARGIAVSLVHRPPGHLTQACRVGP